MSIGQLLAVRERDGKPVRVGLIGAGRMGTAFLVQARHTIGLHVAAVADIEAGRAATALALAGWSPMKAVARTLADALASGGTWVTTDDGALWGEAGLDVLVDATTDPQDGVRHALAALGAGLHVVSLNMGADALAGPMLAAKARAESVVYTLARGTLPARVASLVEWAQGAGFSVAAAGRGCRWLPAHHGLTPATIWDHLGLTADQVRMRALNPMVHTALADGSMMAVEMAAAANATGLTPPQTGPVVPACGIDDLARLMKPHRDGGRLDAMGQIEMVSSQERDGRRVAHPLDGGAFVTFQMPLEVAPQDWRDRGLITDDAGMYGAQWRPAPLAGVETGLSVARACLLGQGHCTASGFVADVVAVAKTDLAPGTRLDGMGGATVWGRLLPATQALAAQALPLGMAQNIALIRAVAAGQTITWKDVDVPVNDGIAMLRLEMDRLFHPCLPSAPPSFSPTSGRD